MTMLTFNSTSKATAAIFIAAVAWGLWWLPVRWLAQQGLVGDLVSVAVFPIGALVLAPVALPHLKLSRMDAILLLKISLLMGATLAMTNAALLTGNVARVLLLFYLAPIWATILSFLVFKEPIGNKRVTSLMLGLGGAFAVLHSAGTWLPLPSSRGEWMGLLAGMAFAGGSSYIRKAELTGSRISDPILQTFSTFTLAGIMGLIFFITLPPASAIVTSKVLNTLPSAFLVAVFWLLPQMWFFAWGSGRLNPAKVAILMLAEPMIAVISAGILLNEPLSLWEITGCTLIILGGVVESFRISTKNPRKK